MANLDEILVKRFFKKIVRCYCYECVQEYHNELGLTFTYKPNWKETALQLYFNNYINECSKYGKCSECDIKYEFNILNAISQWDGIWPYSYTLLKYELFDFNTNSLLCPCDDCVNNYYAGYITEDDIAWYETYIIDKCRMDDNYGWIPIFTYNLICGHIDNILNGYIWDHYMDYRKNTIEWKSNELDTREYSCWCQDCIAPINDSYKPPTISYPKVYVENGHIYALYADKKYKVCQPLSKIKLSLDIIQKIVYYKKYIGFIFKINYYNNKIYISNDIGTYHTGDDSRYKSVPYEYIIQYAIEDVSKLHDGDREIYYKIIDQFCYECNKYKGACLGHVYPDIDEFKNIVSANYANEIKYLKQEIAKLKEKINNSSDCDYEMI